MLEQVIKMEKNRQSKDTILEGELENASATSTNAFNASPSATTEEENGFSVSLKTFRTQTVQPEASAEDGGSDHFSIQYTY